MNFITKVRKRFGKRVDFTDFNSHTFYEQSSLTDRYDISYIVAHH